MRQIENNQVTYRAVKYFFLYKISHVVNACHLVATVEIKSTLPRTAVGPAD